MSVKRASFAPEAVKESGGSGNLWDNATATITGFKFTKEMPNGYVITPKPGEEVSPIGAVVDFEIVGDSPVEERRVDQFFSLGAKVGLSFDVSKDGYYLEPKSEDAQIYSSNFTKFVKSMVENGLPAAVVADGDFSKILGLKGHFKRIENKDAQQKTREFTTKAGEKKSVTEYPRILLCTKILEQPTGKGTSSAPASAASAGDFDLDTATVDALLATLAAKKKPLQRSQLVLFVSQQMGQDVNRAVIAKRASDEAFLTSLAEAGIVNYDAAGKGQPVSLPAAA